MNLKTSALDSEEYLHLAVEAMQRDDHGAALAYLKEGAACFPQNARIAYLLGAENAQIGLYDRAEVEMQRAVSLDPTLYTACFQLGLLQITRGKADSAAQTWHGLDSLPDGHALCLFREGLQALAIDRFGEARSAIQAGVQVNDFSPDLNRDMENLLQRLPEESAAENVTPDTSAHVWFQAYQNPEQPN